MTSEDRCITVVLRLLGGFAGFVAGGFLALLVLILLAVFADQYVGGKSVVPGALVGAAVGFVLGLCYPRLTAGILFWLLSM